MGRAGGWLCLVKLALCLGVQVSVRAQIGPPSPIGPQPSTPPRQDNRGAIQGPVDARWEPWIQDLQDRKLLVRAIRIVDVTGDPRGVAMAAEAADPLVRSLETRVGRAFEARLVSSDCVNLWHERRLVVTGMVQEVDGEVVVVFRIDRRVQIHERIEFRGLGHLDLATAESLLGITADRPVTSTEAEAMRKVLLGRYHRDGYPFCSIRLLEEGVAPNELASERKDILPRRLIIQIDEGERVHIRNIHVIGNYSFAAEPIMGMFGTADYLLRESHIQSDPARGWSKGGPYSREVLEEDLDRLRLFYRSNGFLDATVDLASAVFTDDRTGVDVTFLVNEGVRYRISSVQIQHIDNRNNPTAAAPLYSPEELLKQLKTKPGDFYDHARQRRDNQALQDFYGHRGHPPSSYPGMQYDPAACRVPFPPQEIYGANFEVSLIYQVFEGEPKHLRDVLIRGNQFTRDAVIRQRIRVKPGERIDMRNVDRSLRNLEQTRYFNDPVTMRGPRLQFEPVAGSTDQLDLAVDLQDGSTGELRWGLSYGSGQGPQARIEFNKRNFDISNLPSSANPVTVLSEMIDNKAFHGGGQTLNLLLAPGTRFSQFRTVWFDPDAFSMYEDPIDLRVVGQRMLRLLPDGYTQDTLGAEVGLGRTFYDRLNLSFAVRHDTVEIRDLAGNATVLAYDAEGQTELRGMRVMARYRDYDDFARPTSGFEWGLTGELVGGFLGGDESLTKITHNAQAFIPLRENAQGHRTVLRLEHFFGLARAFGRSDDVFLTERFYMGAWNLRGFSFRRAGPSQFGRPVGGEAIYTATAEVGFPLLATRMENDVRDREVLRWVAFTDIGLLGLAIDDPTFGQLRGSYGVGLRIEVPRLEWPIALDLAWPWRYESTDDRRQFYFTIGSRF